MPAERRTYDVLKRVLDVTLVLAGGVVVLPLVLGLALLVRWKLGSPVLFKQDRPGRDGRIFRMIKFRTMLPAAPGEQPGPESDRRRLVPFGRFLRSTSLDELPELMNVLVGDMSLVGPRPLLPEYLVLYDATQARRHEVRPGITGWAQVNGRNALDWPTRLALDVWYVDHRSLALDLRILCLTAWRVLRRDGITSPTADTMERFTGSRA